MEKIKVEGFDVELRQEDDVYIARVPELPGCVSQGNTKEDVTKSIGKAIRGYLVSLARDMSRKKGKVIPISRKPNKNTGR